VREELYFKSPRPLKAAERGKIQKIVDKVLKDMQKEK
jgi:hypothetical protein